MIVANPAGSDTAATPFQVGPIDTTVHGAINLSWNDCGSSGARLATFDCLSSTGPAAEAFASFRAPNYVSEFIGYQAEIRVTSKTSDLPDWWKFGVGSCRGTSGLTTSFGFDSGPLTCADFSAGRAISGGYSYDAGAFGSNTAKLLVTCSIAYADRFALDP